MKPRDTVLVGLVLLAAAGCGSASVQAGDAPASTSATSVPSSGVPSGTPPRTVPATAPPTMPPSTAVVPSSAAGSALCAGDRTAARTVAVYRALLTDKGSPVEALGKPSRLYVSSQWLDDSFPRPGARVGQIEASVLRCLTAGVPGLPPIVVVSGPQDPAIRTLATSGIRGFADHAKYVTFGDVSSGDTVTSYVTVDAGQGDVAGGKCVLRLRGAEIVSVLASERWIS